LINDDLLIDLGPDIMAASQMHDCSLDNVQYCLQTHPHADHLDLSHLFSRGPAYGVVGAPVLNFYASPETLQRAAETFERDLADYKLLSPEAEKRLNLKIHQTGQEPTHSAQSSEGRRLHRQDVEVIDPVDDAE
jgi:glyoxylase-like metal-dependent hydrolase (beta-lactamase superfamily II)